MSARAKTLLIGVTCFLAGCFAVQTFSTLSAQPPVGSSKKPTWTHGMNISARRANEDKLSEKQRFGVEVYRDAENGNLIYISETGSIAVVPGAK